MKKRVILLLPCLLLVGCKTNVDSSNIINSQVNDNSTSDSSSTKENNSATDQSNKRADYSEYKYLEQLSSLKRTDWHNAKWIWYEKNIQDVYVSFRKSFDISSLPNKAIMYISSDSKTTLWVNGELAIIDGSVKRGANVNDSYYGEYDISKYLKRGKNVLAFEVVYFGQSSNSFISSDQGGLLFDLELDYTHIVSDTTVKVKRMNAYRNKSQLKENYPNHPISSFLAERDIYFDSRLYEEFYKTDYDDSLWNNASIVGNVSSIPFGDLYYADIPPFDFDKDITYMTGNEDILNTKLTENKTLTFSLEANIQFLPYFEIESDGEGKKITFYTNSKTTQNITSFMDDYITKDGEQTYQQYYYRTGMKFIMEVEKGITIKKVGYRKTSYHSEKVGNYKSDNTDLNTLWTKAYNTLNICMRDNYMDCPERERSPYTGDSANQIFESLYALDEDGLRLAKKTYLTLLGWVKNDDLIPSRFPSNTTNEIPLQNLAFIITCYEYYLHTGDIDTVTKIFPIFVNYLKIWDMNEDGSLKYRKGSFEFVDWGSNSDPEIISNSLYVWAINTLLNLNNDLNLLNNEDKSLFINRKTSIKNIFNTNFKTENGFASKNSEGVRRVIDDRANAIAYLASLIDDEDVSLVKNVLTTTEYASPYMERFVLQALSEMNENELSLTRMNKRYKKMIDYKASTLWEEWSEKNEDGTINHGWAGGPLIIMSKYFAGISPIEAGFKKYQIKPSSVSKSYEASVYTPKGILSYTLTSNGEQTSMTIDAIDSDGTLIFNEFGNEIYVDGVKSEDSNSTKILKGKHTYIIK